MSSILLISSVLASLAIGVLLSYAICVGLFRIHSQHAALRREALRVTVTTRSAGVTEG